MKHISLKVPEVIRRNFRFSTLDFLFIILYVNVFQFIFGPENSIVGVIFTIMMSASMARDLTATPFRHLVICLLYTSDILSGIGNKHAQTDRYWNRKETADYLHITIDTLRNWELHGLFTVKRSQNGYRI